jgi:RNA polymerase sigma factor (sigma-70 family)
VAESQHHSEAQLIDSYKVSGDLEMLGKLYKPYMHLVYGVCLKYLKEREESQDAVMQIFEKLIDQVKKHEIDNFKSWLYVLSKNHCLMALRSSKYKMSQRQQEINDDTMESSLLLHHNDESVLENDLAKLEKCIETLQNEQKQCVELFYLEKKPYVIIAEKTGYGLKKVKSYIQNGKRNLKTCMEKQSD